MGLREADSWNYLRLKQVIESRPTNSNAVYQDGSVRPVFIYKLDGKDICVVEGDDYKFYRAQQMPGSAWLRWETKPDAIPPAVEPPSVEPTKITGSTWAEQKANAEMRSRKALAERYDANKAQQTGLTAPDAAFAIASHQDAQINATRKGQSGPNSKIR